ncbi:uncharacterized protein LOC110449575 [Mizuhopecten yessoensis]|uniref:uncharacterized protein LOC110449575 n=1 Tax=Mizuhopecten yessoensis TaxID=6573 RepID=UPI000B45951B|nr:uncharacterized protein LOC110449575 [Mizuhopecten yessoensis]
MAGHRQSLACVLIFTFHSVVGDNCWIARTGQTEWCNGYCCDTPNKGWGCCCDEGDDVQTIVLGLFALLLLAFGIILCVIKVVICYLGGDIYVHVHRKIERSLVKWRRGNDELHLRKISEEKRLRRLFKERVSGTSDEEWRKMAMLYGMQEEGDDEMGHELSCLCCNRYRVSFGKV